MASGSTKAPKGRLGRNTTQAIARRQWIRQNTRSGARSSTGRTRGW